MVSLCPSTAEGIRDGVHIHIVRNERDNWMTEIEPKLATYPWIPNITMQWHFLSCELQLSLLCHFVILKPISLLSKPKLLLHSGQFCWFSKTCHFSNIRCFLQPFFKQTSSNVTPGTFLPHFWRFQFLIQTDHFAKPIVFALWQNGHFAKAVVRQHWLTLGFNFKERKSCKKISTHERDFLWEEWLKKTFTKWQN